jgi:hypothetical protein
MGPLTTLSADSSASDNAAHYAAAHYAAAHYAVKRLSCGEGGAGRRNVPLFRSGSSP